MSDSLSTELSYGEPLGYPAESDTLSIPNEREPTPAADQLPDSSDSSTVADPQFDNRLSVVSAASLEPRRRTRHHNGSRHSHIHRDLAHMLSVSARDAKELRRGLNAAYSKLDQSRERASHAEKLALDMLLRVREAEEERERAMREASAIREDLGRHKALLDGAHGEIRRGQRLLQDQEHLRYEAEAAAARARDNARQMKQRRLIELAREQGRKLGYDEGVQAGQRIGYYDGQSPGDGTKVYFDEGPRFREVFDENNHRLDDFDQPRPVQPPAQPNPSSSNDLGAPFAPQATHPTYAGLQVQYDEIPAMAHGTSTPPSEVPHYTSPLTRVARPSSSDSSSTTTLPAAPVPLRALFRAPPMMPTIPEASSTELGSTSGRSRSQRDSPRMHGYIQPAPQAPEHNVVPHFVVPHLQDPATFEPPPGSVGAPPPAPGTSSHDDIFPSIVHPLQDHAAFEPPPGSVGMSPALAPQASAHDVVFSSFRPPPGSVDEDPSAPAIGHHQRPGGQPVYGLSSPRGGYDNANNVTVSEGIRSPVQERFASAPEATSNRVQGRYASAPGNASSTVQEHFPSASEYAPSQVRERFPSTHSRRTSRSRTESMRLADELRNPDSSTRTSSRSDGSTPRRDGPPRRRPVPQMPAPLAPQSAPNVTHGQGSQSSVRYMRPSGFDYGMPGDADMNAGSNTAVDRRHSLSRGIPGLAERPTDRAPAQHSDAASRQSYGGQHPGPNTARDSYPQAAPHFIPNEPPTGQQVAPQNRSPRIHPQSYGGQRPGSQASTVRDSHLQAAPHFMPHEPSTGQREAPQNRPPSVQVQSYGEQHPIPSTVRDSHLQAAPHFMPHEPSTGQREAPQNRPPSVQVQSYGEQHPIPSTVRDPHPQAAPHLIPNEPSAGQQTASQNRSPRIHAQSYGEQYPGANTVRESHPQGAPHFIPNEPSAGQQAASHNRSSSMHVQIPPTGYFAPDPASDLATLPTHDQMSPTDIYSPGAVSSPNPNVSDSHNQSLPRYPPTLYNEPKLQQQSFRSADYQQEQTPSSPTLPVPSRSSRATSQMMNPPQGTASRRNSYVTRQGAAPDSPYTPTDALPVPPPSLSPHPSPAAFARQIPPPQGAMTSSTPRRPTSPNPLPRSSSPAPLPRASSPAPLPIRSPSVRSAHIHRNASDVSLPGAPGSPYSHYNPTREANIAVLASSSADKLGASSW